MPVGMDTPGRCALSSCDRAIPLDHLMCGRHWRLVPSREQQILWRAYLAAKRTGGGVLGNEHYGRARDECIRAVQAKLGL